MKTVIISGGHMDDGFAMSWLLENKIISAIEEGERKTPLSGKLCCTMKSSADVTLLAADSGMDFLYRNGILPDVIAGDFDSVSSEALEFFKEQNVQMITLNPMKDDTDTEFVIREALRRGATEITILGATGTRLDHVLGNIHLLGIGLKEKVEIALVDAHNRIRIIAGETVIKKSEQFGDFISLLPIDGEATGVTLEGFKYPLSKSTVPSFCSLGISNEIIEKEAKITVEKGTLVMIESRD